MGPPESFGRGRGAAPGVSGLEALLSRGRGTIMSSLAQGNSPSLKVSRGFSGHPTRKGGVAPTGPSPQTPDGTIPRPTFLRTGLLRGRAQVQWNVASPQPAEVQRHLHRVVRSAEEQRNAQLQGVVVVAGCGPLEVALLRRVRRRPRPLLRVDRAVREEEPGVVGRAAPVVLAGLVKLSLVLLEVVLQVALRAPGRARVTDAGAGGARAVSPRAEAPRTVSPALLFRRGARAGAPRAAQPHAPRRGTDAPR